MFPRNRAQRRQEAESADEVEREAVRASGSGIRRITVGAFTRPASSAAHAPSSALKSPQISYDRLGTFLYLPRGAVHFFVLFTQD